MCPNPVCGPFGYRRVPLRQRNQPHSTSLWHFLYYAITIDNTILPSLSDISSDQSKATKNTDKQVAKLLTYLASNPNIEIQYRASGTQLAINSDTSYLSVSQARSRASGVHFLSEGPPKPKNPEDFVPTVNSIILFV